MMIKVYQPLTPGEFTWTNEEKILSPGWDGPKTKLPTIKDI